MIRLRPPALFTLFATVAVGACEFPTTEVSGNPVGVGALSASTQGAAYTTNPVLTFYRVTGAIFIRAQDARDTCFITAYSDSTSEPQVSASPVSAGAFVALQIGTRTDTLRRATTGVDPTYRASGSAGFPFTPGDSMIITVDGDPNGFPTSTFRGRTAEPFVVDPLDVPEAGSPMVVTWTPAGGPDAAMLMSFPFAAGTSATRNQQVACTFLDDGEGLIPATPAGAWINATNRTMSARRIRTILTQVDVPLSYFNIVSSFSWPTPASP